MRFYTKYRDILLNTLLALAGLVIWRIPSLFYLDELLQAPLFTPEAWAAMIGLFVGGLILGFLKPTEWIHFGVALGLGPLIYTALRFMNESIGTLWAVELLLTLVIGILPALAGAWLGRLARTAQGLHH